MHQYFLIMNLVEAGKFKDSKYFLVMKLHSNVSEDLKLSPIFRDIVYISESKNRAVNKILDLGISVIRSLQMLHKIGYVHGDIKPSNILYDVLEDSKECFRLIDFGISSLYTTDDGEHIQKTPKRTFNGSIEFAATDVIHKYRTYIFILLVPSNT